MSRVTLLEPSDVASEPRDADFEALDEPLTALEQLNVRQSRVVELRFFGGLPLEDAAHVLGISVGTVRRDWDLAKAWLFRELEGKSR